MRIPLLIALLSCTSGAALAAEEGEPAIGVEPARDILFQAKPDKSAPACEKGTDAERIVCLLRARYAVDPKAAKIAVEVFERTGSVAGVLPEQDFDGGYRGNIHMLPHLPADATRKHLEWTAAAFLDYDAFFQAIQKDAGHPARYRFKALDLRFYESVKKRTPAAFAHAWSVAYNVNGTLNWSANSVRELLFHEIFHLNDHAHDDWSETALAPTFDAIAKRCGFQISCLAPYAPDYIIVHGGTYYPWMPGNGVREYAADLSVRYFREQRAARQGAPPKKPFKCATPENARVWELIAREFFAGVDRVPACPRAR